jgi:uncharacterized membrane protein YeaQ/YmgE (transglycosylase-associated protein family)
MTIVAWLILGLLIGWAASLLIVKGSYGLFGDIVVGVLGAINGGVLASWLVGIEVTGFSYTSVGIGAICSVAGIVVFRALAFGVDRLPGGFSIEEPCWSQYTLTNPVVHQTRTGDRYPADNKRVDAWYMPPSQKSPDVERLWTQNHRHENI